MNPLDRLTFETAYHKLRTAPDTLTIDEQEVVETFGGTQDRAEMHKAFTPAYVHAQSPTPTPKPAATQTPVSRKRLHRAIEQLADITGKALRVRDEKIAALEQRVQALEGPADVPSSKHWTHVPRSPEVIQ